jgi:type IV pilus biogenesis protein CpaD/CtpE
MTSGDGNRVARGIAVAVALIALGLSSGCATRGARRAATVPEVEAAQPTCRPADFLPGRPAAAPPADGCWNDANLARMVADPGDLARGRPLGPASGAREALAVEAYRRGQAKPLAGGQDSNGPALQLPTVLGATGP